MSFAARAVLGSTAVRPCKERERRCHHAIVCTRDRVLGHLLELPGLCRSRRA